MLTAPCSQLSGRTLGLAVVRPRECIHGQRLGKARRSDTRFEQGIDPDRVPNRTESFIKDQAALDDIAAEECRAAQSR